MSTTPTGGGAAASTPSEEGQDLARQLGVTPSMVVAEFGFDADADEKVSVAIEQFLGADLVGEDTDEVYDIALLWFRTGGSDADNDLVDALVDVITGLAEDGAVWLLTPKRGRDGYVQPSDIAEAAPVAGLSQTS
ncbi:MAG: DUF3052 domain-containing protein, partial [Janthinobacterium lividum]